MKKSHTEATKKKIGDAHRGKKLSVETKEKIGDANRGKKHSKATRRKLREAARRRNGDPKKRFWYSVDKSGGSDSCWEWIGYRHPQGYGVFFCKRSSQLAHRVAWQMVFGSIEKGVVIRHVCDNTSCCNPLHLRAGTQRDNVLDMVSKGRNRRGEAVPSAKLNKEKVLDIVREIALGSTQTAIAAKFKISNACVSNIVNGRTWKHVFGSGKSECNTAN